MLLNIDVSGPLARSRIIQSRQVFKPETLPVAPVGDEVISARATFDEESRILLPDSKRLRDADRLLFN